MSEGRPDFRSSLRRILHKVDGEDHPSLDTLEAFHWGDLPTEEADVVRVHLSGCARCLDLLAKLDEIDEAAAADVEVPPGELERSLGRVQELLHAEAALADEAVGADSPAAQASRAQFFPRWSTAPGPYALAAASLVAGIGLSLWLASRLELERQRLPELESRLTAATARTTAAEEKLQEVRQQARTLEQQAIAARRERDQLLAPQPNTPIVMLRASAERGGGEIPAVEIRFDTAGEFFTLVLENRQEAHFPAYRLEIVNKEGRRVSQVEGLRLTEFRNFVVTIAKRSLPPGPYRLRVMGLRGRRTALVAEYPLILREGPSSSSPD